jgi:hypothetical protein
MAKLNFRGSAALVLIVSMAALAGCGKGGNIAPQTTGGLMFVNASLNQRDIDIYSFSSQVASGLTYPDSTGYMQVGVGTAFSLAYFPTGNTSDTLEYGYTDFPTAAYYSFFFIDSAGGHVQVADLEDVLTVPSADSIKLRFLNFSISSPAVDLVNAGSSQALYSGVGFNTNVAAAETFTTLPSGAYTFSVRATGTTTQLTSLNNVALSGGGIYTLFLKGTADSLGIAALSVGVLRNK